MLNNSFLFRTFLFLSIILVYSCNNKIDNKTYDFNDNIKGSWYLLNLKGETPKEYVECYISNEDFYVLSEHGLINIFSYEIGENSIFIANDSVTENNPRVKIFEDKFSLVFNDSIEVVYKKIDKGIMPKVFIDDKTLKDCYFESFFKRKEVYDRTKLNIEKQKDK